MLKGAVGGAEALSKRPGFVTLARYVEYHSIMYLFMYDITHDCFAHV